MKLTKKVLSLILAVLMVSSAMVCSSAATTHSIPVSGIKTIPATEYTSATSVYLKDTTEVASSGDITVDGEYVNIIKEKKVSLTTRQVVSTVTYTLNVEQAGYYRIGITGLYTSAAPTVSIAVDDAPAISAKSFATTEKTANIGHFTIPAGQHTLTVKFSGGNASFKNIVVRNMEKEVGTGVTRIPIVDYISTNNTAGTRDYSSNGVKNCIPVSSAESANLGSSSGLTNKYKINVAEAGQYKLSAWSGRNKSNIYANVCVISEDGKTVIAEGSGIPGSGLTTTAGVSTSAFNLSAGSQTLVFRFRAVNEDPIYKENDYLYLYYIELEKVGSTMSVAELSSELNNEVEIEEYVYTDNGVTKEADSVVVSGNKTASLYVNIPTEGNYAVSMKYKAEADTQLYANNGTTDIYKNELIDTNGDYLTHTLSVVSFKAGANRIDLNPTQDLEIDKIYIKKISDESVLSAISAANKEDELKAAVASLETGLEINLTDTTYGIFYDKPVYNRLLKRDYSSVAEFVKKYNESVLYEYNNPWVTLYVNNVKTTELATGDIKFTATTGYIPKGSTMIAVIYRHADDVKILHNFSICEEVSENSYDFNLGQTEIKDDEVYTVDFFYWNGLKTVTPIDVFDSVYEEIYVSTDGSDTEGDGTEEKPFATIQKALAKVSEINENQWGDIIINVGGGIYTLTETLEINEDYSGKNGFDVIIRGEEGNQPIISGGKKVEKWQIDEGNIWKAPLKNMNYVRNLYVNGYPAIMARSDRFFNTAEQQGVDVPTTIHKVGAEESDLQHIDLKVSTTGLNDNTVKNWSNNAFSLSKEEIGVELYNPIGMEFVWPYTFENHITPVTNYKETEEDIAFLMNADLLQRRESSAFNTGVSFYLQNDKALINKPGEFYYDKAEGYIYYYPYSYEDMTTVDAYVGNVEGMVKVAGSSLDSKVENITFENLRFSYGANNFASKYGYIGSQTDGILVPFEWSEGQIAYLAQFAVDNADNVNIKGCEFSCLGSAAISFIDSVSNSSIDGNIIRDTAGTGIRIGHPIHNRERDGVEVCRNINVTNNVIRRIAGESFNNCGITVYYEKFINILHNDIENVPYSGMSIGWGWGGGDAYDCSDINVSYNKVQDVMNTLHDGGGIYTLGPLKNTKISNNYLKGHGSRSGGMIYNDQGSAYIEVFDNVVLDAVISHSINASNTTATRNLKIYDNYSDLGTHSKIKTEQQIEFEKYTIVSGEGETLNNDAAKAIYQNAGLESEYLSLLSKAGVELPAGGREISSDLPAPAPSDVTVISAADFDKGTSTQDLEMIPYADGIGTVINSGEKVTYKLDIPEAGYYRIILRAAGNSSQSNGIKVSGDAQDVTMRIYQGYGGNISNQLAIANDGYRNYRICTAYFEEGKQDITFTTASSGDSVIIKEVHYAPLMKNVKSNGVNVISLKNYYKVSGLNTNTYENSQTGYTSEGAKYHTTGAITNGGNSTTTLTYKLNVAEAGTYKVTAASWVGANSPVTYQILLDGEVKSEGTTKTYSRLTKSEDTVMSDLTLPAGEVELVFKAKSNGSNYSIMYYFTLEKNN